LRFGSATDSQRGQIAIKGTLEVFEHIAFEDASGTVQIAAEDAEGVERGNSVSP